MGSPLFVLTYQDLRNSYIKKLFLDFGQGAKLDLLVIVELGFVGPPDMGHGFPLIMFEIDLSQLFLFSIFHRVYH